MATADSIIRVSIVGDVKKLTGALSQADTATGGLIKSAAKVAVGLGIVREGFDFAQDATEQADRLGDATARLDHIIGETDTQKLSDIAENFHDLGLSKQDVLELAANFGDIATNAGIGAPDIAVFADDVAATAAAMSLVDDEGRAPADFVDAIGKAAKGNQKSMQLLGINIDDAAVAAQALTDTGKPTVDMLTDGELATARLKLIMEKLKPKLDDATTGTHDLEQSQRDLQAQVETLQAKLGGPLSDALNVVLGFILDEIDAIPGAIDGWNKLGDAVLGFARTVAAPLGNINDLAHDLANTINGIGKPKGIEFRVSTSSRSGISEKQVTQAVTRVAERNGVRDRVGGP